MQTFVVGCLVWRRVRSGCGLGEGSVSECGGARRREVHSEDQFSKAISGAMRRAQAVPKSTRASRSSNAWANLDPASIASVSEDRHGDAKPADPVCVEDRIGDPRSAELAGDALERFDTQSAGVASSAPLDLDQATQHVGGVGHRGADDAGGLHRAAAVDLAKRGSAERRAQSMSEASHARCCHTCDEPCIDMVIPGVDRSSSVNELGVEGRPSAAGCRCGRLPRDHRARRPTHRSGCLANLAGALHLSIVDPSARHRKPSRP